MITTSLSEHNQLSFDRNRHESAEAHTEQTFIYVATYSEQTQAREAESSELQSCNQRIHEGVQIPRTNYHEIILTPSAAPYAAYHENSNKSEYNTSN